MDVRRSHLVAIIGGVVHENPYYVPPDDLPQELRQHPRQPSEVA